MLMFSRGCLNFVSIAKSHMQINHKFHPIDKDERLLSIASDIKVLNTQLERDWRRLENFLNFRGLMIVFPSFRQSSPIISPKK